MEDRKPYWDVSLLYVEDEELIRSKITDFFDLRVGKLHIACDGAEGLELYKAHRPDIVVSDVKMPKMNGLEMAQEIKAIDPEVKIIITSAFNDQDFLLSAIEVGVNRYVLKPIRRELMKDALEECVEQTRLKRLRKEQDIRTRQLLDMQDNIVVMTDGQKMQYGNHAFLEFFDLESLDKFFEHHTCICDFFEPEEEYLQKEKQGKSWIEQLLEETNQGKESKTRMQGQVFLVRHKNLDDAIRVISFTNISQLERHHLELERKQLEQEKVLVQQGKMAEVGNLIGAIIHQWKQPLNAISLIAGSLVDRHELQGPLSLEDLTDIEGKIEKQVQFMSETMNGFKNYFTPETKMRPFRLFYVIETTLSLLQFRTKKESTEVKLDVDEDLGLFGYPNELRQVLFNLLNNALDAIKETGRREGRIRIVTKEQEQVVELIICDNGSGIPDALLPDKLFEAHLTTKGDKGTGIGLSISRGIIAQRFGGTIRAENGDEGALFTVTLPKYQEEEPELKDNNLLLQNDTV